MILDRLEKANNLQELKREVLVVVVFVQMDVNHPFSLFHAQVTPCNLFHSMVEHGCFIGLTNDTHSFPDEGSAVVTEWENNRGCVTWISAHSVNDQWNAIMVSYRSKVTPYLISDFISSRAPYSTSHH